MGILLLRVVMELSVELTIFGHFFLYAILFIGVLLVVTIRNLSTRYDKRVELKNARKNSTHGIEPILQKLYIVRKYPGATDLHQLDKLLTQRLAALKGRDAVQGAKLLDYEISNRRFLLLLELFTQVTVLHFFPITRRHTFFYAFEINGRTSEIVLLGDEDLRTGKYHEDLGKMVDLCPGWLEQELLGR